MLESARQQARKRKAGDLEGAGRELHREPVRDVPGLEPVPGTESGSRLESGSVSAEPSSAQTEALGAPPGLKSTGEGGAGSSGVRCGLFGEIDSMLGQSVPGDRGPGCCVRNAECVRGYRHGGRGGPCKVRVGPRSRAPRTRRS